MQNKSGKVATEEDADLSNEEYIVEKIIAKRFNPKKKCSEYLIKWEGYLQWVFPINHMYLSPLKNSSNVLKILKFYSENNTWESAENVASCKNILEEFERSLAKQKELKSQQQANMRIVGRASLPAQKSVIKAEASKPGPSTASQAG